MGNKEQLDADLLALMALGDDEIDTSDIPEAASFAGADVGRYSDIEFRNYDVRSIANWCISRARRENVTISNMWLNKIVYFIYERALQKFDVLLTPARAEAWNYGPVFREIYGSFPSDPHRDLYYKYDIRLRRREIATDSFEPADVNIFEQVWRDYGHLSASKLMKISHERGSAWDKIWSYKGRTNPGMVIDIETILGRNTGHSHGNP